jgi:hypothetical protein
MITLSRKLFATVAFGFVLLYMVLLYCDTIADPLNNLAGRFMFFVMMALFIFSTRTYLRLHNDYKWYDLLIIISIMLTWMVISCAMLAMYAFTLGWN